ncbi:MAG TPA: hypothetical protein VNE38_04970, partial [Ktedonobacteraceae bacterium]|nr:hypothetical protein [Ktedonobacteraceae bacterium]
SGFSLTHDNRVTLSKIGSVKLVSHRPVKGTIKTCTVQRSSTGKWYVCFSVECAAQRLPDVPSQVGIDVGLKTFATTSDGIEIWKPPALAVGSSHYTVSYHRQSHRSNKDNRQHKKGLCYDTTKFISRL